MKKMFASLLALSMVLVGCGGDGGDSASSSKPEIVMLTDKGTIDDKSFNQGTYEGVKAYAEKNGIECTSNLLMQQQMNTTILLIRL